MGEESETIELLAAAVQEGGATAEEVDRLWALTADVARTVLRRAVMRGKLPAGDLEDIMQDALMRGLRYLQRWNARKGRWSTYFSHIVWSALGEGGRRRWRTRCAEIAWLEASGIGEKLAREGESGEYDG